VGVTAYAAVRAADPKPGETVAVSAASGGVGSLVVQLLSLRDVRTIGIASPTNHPWLSDNDVIPVRYGDHLVDRIRSVAAHGVDAFIDLFGPEYIDVALALGVPPDRIETIISYEAAERHGTKAQGSQDASTPEILATIAGLVADGKVEVPIAAVYPFDEVRTAYKELAQRHTHGKIVLVPDQASA
jgi:NADPH:quinone reductase